MKFPKFGINAVLFSAILTVTAGAFAGWSGSGSFTRSHDWTDDAAAAIPITASRMDTEDDNFTTGINACLAKNGENAATGNLNIGGYRLTSVGAGSSATDAATIGGTETLSNKTIASPALSGTVSGNVTVSGNNTYSGTSAFTGAATFSSGTTRLMGTAGAALNIDSDTDGTGEASSVIGFRHGASALDRWGISKNSSGNFEINRYDNAGALAGVSIGIARASGELTLEAPLPVASGGTGIATTTAYGIIAAGTTATGDFQQVGTGTSGQVLVSAGNAALPAFQSKPAFSAYLTADQTVTVAGSPAVVEFASEVFDTHGYLASNAFTPLVAGKYLVAASVNLTLASNASTITLMIYKNGTPYKYARVESPTSTQPYTLSISDVIDFNGVDDDVDIRLTTTDASNTVIEGTATESTFYAYRVDI